MILKVMLHILVLGNLKAEIKAIVTMKPNRLAEKFSKPFANVVLNLGSIEIGKLSHVFVAVLMTLFMRRCKQRSVPRCAPTFAIVGRHNKETAILGLQTV
jgi:hypothetical protein